ncbi:glycosyltransferase family 4 protein [Sphingomonas sp. G124]|uniref:Glycosyltransferase family 4 protein n=1 Tax=Sphingomonas cremea TaxID=2904799 RepID=A0A9X1TXR5_9SPHN|nr:glycosyltransferase family 1 protein [Sphingomonas cremea]MCF2514388.1 glycosyltransferase family 4 protein [Sphingomonas cremea]
MSKSKKNRKISVLVEMRPALEGFAGIPQEVRLLFRGLRQLNGVEVEGLLQTSHRFLSAGMPEKGRKKFKNTYALNRYSKVIVSLAEQPFENVFDRVSRFMRRKLNAFQLTVLLSLGLGKIRLGRFESKEFQDFTWRILFSKSLPARDFGSVASADHRICSVPWNTMHMTGLSTLTWRRTALYPTLVTPDVDVFIGQTPYPGRVAKGTKMVIRYHDAIPVLMPHTIPDKSIHQATHFRALEANVRHGAWFACVSETTRQDLLKIFPEAEPRAITIHNMVSHNYFAESPDIQAAKRVVRTRLYEQSGWLPKFLTSREKESFYRKHIDSSGFRYLLMVSTIEPRKNHARLIAAWEYIKANIDPDLKLITVGTLGWDYGTIQTAVSGWMERGELFMLNAVPTGDLRTLYRNALATVCPSLGEGFDFSGVESMASGGITIASDIPVHREVYDDAALFFDPYSTASLVQALKQALYEDVSPEVEEQLRERGQQVSGRYQPEVILPKWQQFLAQLSSRTGLKAVPAGNGSSIEEPCLQPTQQPTPNTAKAA